MKSELSNFQSACKENGVELAFAHAGYLINLATTEDATHARSMLSMRQELERAEAIELPYLTSIPVRTRGQGN